MLMNENIGVKTEDERSYEGTFRGLECEGML